MSSSSGSGASCQALWCSRESSDLERVKRMSSKESCRGGSSGDGGFESDIWAEHSRSVSIAVRRSAHTGCPRRLNLRSQQILTRSGDIVGLLARVARRWSIHDS